MRVHIFEFTTSYLDKAGAKLRSQYEKSDAGLFASEFKVSDSMMNDFIEFGKARGVEFKQEEYDADKQWLRASIEAQIARTLYGNEGSFRVLLDVDPQFQKALTLFPEAKKIAELH